MYERHKGDDLCKDNPKLKYNWDWCRIASGYNQRQLESWTHFQSSEAHIGSWICEAVQWGGDIITYEARIAYVGDTIASTKDDIKTRLEAQVIAEQLLIDWITEEYQSIVKEMEGNR